MNDIMNLEAAILAADPDDMFEETNYLELFLEKESANARRRSRKATAKVQKKRLNTILQAEGYEISNPVEKGKNRDHATYSHLDFNSDGSNALNRIVNKESKKQILNGRSKTYFLADINTIAYAEAEAEAAEQAEAERLEAFYAYRALVDEVKQMCNLALLEEEKSWASMMDALALC